MNHKRKKYAKIARKIRSDEILLDEVNSDIEDDIDNLMNDSDAECVLEESLEKELNSDDEPLILLVLEANYHVVEDPTIEKILEEGSSKAEKEVTGKNKEKSKVKEIGKGKGKLQRKKQGKKQRKRNQIWLN